MRAAKDEPLSYKAAGVDIDAGNELVNRIKKMNPSIGGFNGLFPFGTFPCSPRTALGDNGHGGRFLCLWLQVLTDSAAL